MPRDFLVTIIVPLYNEEGSILKLTNSIDEVMKPYRYELLLVNDGSEDKTLDLIKEAQKDNPRLKFISFTRNFGHQMALKAGLDHASGECIVMMDGDLQHPPSLIPNMLDYWQQGYEVVSTKRKSGKEGLFKKVSSGLFYSLVNLLSETKVEKGSADFRLLDRKVADVLRELPEPPVSLYINTVHKAN